LALKAREPRRLIIALATEAVFAAMLDGARGSTRCQHVQERINEIAVHARSALERAVPTLVRAICEYWMGYWSEVVDLALAAEEILREDVAGTLWEASLLRSIRHTVLLHDGRFDDLESELPDALGQAMMYDDQYTCLDLLRRKVALLLSRDEVDKARDVVQQLSAMRDKHGFVAQDHLIMSLVVSLHLYTGEVARARSELDTRWAACRKMGMNRFPLVRLTVIGMEANCTALDETIDPRRRSKALQRLAHDASTEEVGWAMGLKHELLGQSLVFGGNSTKAATEFAQASREFALSGLGMCSAIAEWRKHQQVSAHAGQANVRSRIANVKNPATWMRIVHSLY